MEHSGTLCSTQQRHAARQGTWRGARTDCVHARRLRRLRLLHVVKVALGNLVRNLSLVALAVHHSAGHQHHKAARDGGEGPQEGA